MRESGRTTAGKMKTILFAWSAPSPLPTRSRVDTERCAILRNFVTLHANSYNVYSRQFLSRQVGATRCVFCPARRCEKRLIVNLNLSNREFKSGRAIDRVFNFFGCHLSRGLSVHLSRAAWWKTPDRVYTEYYAAYHRRYDNELFVRRAVSHFRWIPDGELIESSTHSCAERKCISFL